MVTSLVVPDCPASSSELDLSEFFIDTMTTLANYYFVLQRYRGSELAEFLTDGDSQSDVKKSVAELQEFDFDGVEQCRELAMYYSNQLFTIYSNKEDPLFSTLMLG